MNKVFLSGPIRGLKREDSLGWRKLATDLLCDFDVVHALRNREETETLPDPRLAIIRDKRDIADSDIILVNDDFVETSMIGTAMEVIYAYEKSKVIVIFGNGHEKDYWLNFHSHVRVKTLQDACEVINTFFKKRESRI